MDVHCSTCNEAYDVHTLLLGDVTEIFPSEKLLAGFRSRPRVRRLTRRYRQKCRREGWQFGRTPLNIIRCPNCAQDAKPDVELMVFKRELEEEFAHEPLRLAFVFEEYGL